MTADSLRVALATEFYPPHPGAAAESAQRLAHGLAHAGVQVVIFTCAGLGAKPITAHASDHPRVYRASCVFEGFVLLDREEADRPFDVLHALGWRIAAACLSAPARHAHRLLVSLTDDDDADDRRAPRVLARIAWIASPNLETHERVRQRCGDTTPGSVIAADDGVAYLRLYAQLARLSDGQDAMASLLPRPCRAARPLERV